MIKVCFVVKRILLYMFVTIAFYLFGYMIIDIIFKEPIFVNKLLNTYITGLEVFLCIILIILFSYIILYIKKNKINMLEIITVLILILVITFPKLYNTAIYKSEKLKEIKLGIEIINKDLIHYFNADDYSIRYVGYYDGCHLICTDIPTYNYQIYVDKLDSTYKITINADTLEIKENELINS